MAGQFFSLDVSWFHFKVGTTPPKVTELKVYFSGIHVCDYVSHDETEADCEERCKELGLGQQDLSASALVSHEKFTNSPATPVASSSSADAALASSPPAAAAASTSPPAFIMVLSVLAVLIAVYFGLYNR